MMAKQQVRGVRSAGAGACGVFALPFFACLLASSHEDDQGGRHVYSGHDLQ